MTIDSFWKQQMGDFKKKNQSFEEYDPIKSLGYIRLNNIIKSLMGDGKILEPGCGTGICLCYLAENYNCTALDISGQALAYHRLLAEQKSVGTNIVQGDIFSMPFRDNEFSLVFNSGVLEHETPEKQERMLGEMIRCSNDYVLVTVPNSGGVFDVFMREVVHRGKCISYDETEYDVDLMKLFDKSGLKDINTDGLLIYTLNNRLKEDDQEVIQFYDKKGISLENNQEVYQNLDELIKVEESCTKAEREKYGFFKIIMGRK